MSSKLSAGILLGSALLLSACATTPKQPLTFDQIGQFSAYPLNAQNYRISYKAPRNMSHGTAEEITLVKAAQTTVKQGFQFFKVLNTPTSVNQTPREAIVYPYPNSYPYYYGFNRYSSYSMWNDPFFNRPYIVQVDSSHIAYDIEMYSEGKQSNDAFDARLILKNVGAKYGVTETGEILQPQMKQQK